MGPFSAAQREAFERQYRSCQRGNKGNISAILSLGTLRTAGFPQNESIRDFLERVSDLPDTELAILTGEGIALYGSSNLGQD